jgi:uncharacterized protein
MKRSEIIAILLKHADELRASGVAHVALFGSAARDDAGPDSDIDLIVEPTPEKPITLFNLGPLHDRFAALLGRPVDIIAKAGFDRSTRLRKSASPDIVHVF